MNFLPPAPRYFNGNGGTDPFWSDAEVELIRKLAPDHTQTQIAHELSKQFGRVFTKNMVAGVCHRRDIAIRHGNRRSPFYTYRNTPARPNRPKRIRVKSEGQTRRELRRSLPVDEEISWQRAFVTMFGSEPVSFEEVKNCRYPVSDELWCNAPIAQDGEVSAMVKNACPWYCRGHALIATNPRAA